MNRTRNFLLLEYFAPNAIKKWMLIGHYNKPEQLTNRQHDFTDAKNADILGGNIVNL